MPTSGGEKEGDSKRYWLIACPRRQSKYKGVDGKLLLIILKFMPHGNILANPPDFPWRLLFFIALSLGSQFFCISHDS